MAQPAKFGKRFTKAKMEKVRAYCDSQARMASKKKVDKTRRAFSKDILRAIDRARKQRLALNTPKRASRSGANGSRRQQGNKDGKKAAPRAVNKVVNTLVKGHLNIKKADEAVIEELQEQLKESQDELNRLKEYEEPPPYEQEAWEAPMLPDHLAEVIFPQDGTDQVPVEEVLKQAPGAAFY